MDLSLSDEQQLLKDSAARFVQDQCSIESRRALRDTELGFDPDLWRQFAELGWLALPFAEEDGGLGGSALDVMVLQEEFGRGLVAEPFLVNVVVCGGLLQRAAEAIREQTLPALMAGESQWAFAYAETGSRYRPNDVSLSARADGDDYILDGQKIAVLNGPAADTFLVTARTSGARRDEQGISVFMVDADCVEQRSYGLVDGSRGSDLVFDGVRVPASAMVYAEGEALPAIEDVIFETLVAIGAEAVGAIDALLEQTVDYAKTREQFGQAIGRFQALQHGMADMYLHAQMLRSLLYYAAIARTEGRSDAQQYASGLKVKVGESGRFVAQQSVQMHGGIGTTDELGISHYFKRLLLLNTLFGDSDYHLVKFSQL